jgi:hypothetical protein
MPFSLIHPGLFMAGAACVAIPILIHFFMRRRRTPIRWGAMRFLIEAYRQQRRRIRFEQFLLLALRCLLISLIALAIARPVADARSGHARAGPVTLYLLIDNSLASSARDASGTRALDRHLERARLLLSRLDQARGDRAAIVTLAAPPDALVLPPSPDLAGVRSMLERVEATESIADLPAAAALLRDQMVSAQADRDATVAVLSEFRAGSADVQRALPGLTVGAARPRVLASRPTAEAITNLTVLAAEPLTPVLLRTGASSSPVRVTVRRDGAGVAAAQSTAVRVWLTRPGVESTPFTAIIRWAPGQTLASVPVQTETPPAQPGAPDDLVVRAGIDQDAIAGDNDLYRRVVVRESIGVALIAPRETGVSTVGAYGPLEWLSLALEPVAASRWSGEGPASEVKTRRVDPAQIDAAALAGLDAAFVITPDLVPGTGWERLRRFVDAGGLVVVFPARDAAPASWAPAMIDALGLPWIVGPEVRVFDAPMPFNLDVAAVNTSALARLAAELPDLIRPVSASRAIEIGPSGTVAAVLSVGPGLPVLALDAPGSRPEGSSRTARGLVALLALAPDLSWTDLPAKPLMVPLVHELLRQGVGRSAGAAHAVAGAVPALPAGAVSVRVVDGPALAATSGPVFTAGMPLTRAGVYRVADERGVSLGLMTVDADPGAGLVEARTEGEIGAWLSGLGAAPEWLDGGEALSISDGASASIDPRTRSAWSAWLFLAAAIIALTELVLARLFSHAPAVKRTGVPSSPAGVAA